MRSYFSLCLLITLSCTSAKNVYAVDIFGLWGRTNTSQTYTFRPTEGNGIALVVVAGKYNDIYLGTLDHPYFRVCTADTEPFSACWDGVVNSDTSISAAINGCQDKTEVAVCKYLSQSIELSREIFHDINGIFAASTGKYFMIEDGGGRITAHELDVEDGEVDGYSGNRDGNSGSVIPFDNSGPYLDFNITSGSAITVTVTKCNDCAPDDAAKTPPGYVATLTRVTN